MRGYENGDRARINLGSYRCCFYDRSAARLNRFADICGDDEMKRYDTRCSKETLLKRIKTLEFCYNRLFERAEDGIYHVGAANYSDREEEALRWIEEAYKCAFK